MKIDFHLKNGRVVKDTKVSLAIRCIRERSDKIDAVTIDGCLVGLTEALDLLSRPELRSDNIDAATYAMAAMTNEQARRILDGMPIAPSDPNEEMQRRDRAGANYPAQPIAPRHYDSFQSIVMDRAMRVTHARYNSVLWQPERM